MANIKSAKKRIKVIDRRNAENRLIRATISTHRKNFKKFVAEKDFANAEKKFKETEKLVYSAVSKGVFHQNKADRIVARMSALLYHSADNKQEAAPAPVEKKVAKKVEVAPAPAVEEKKAPAKKAAPKKTAAKEEKAEVAKKPAAKKTTAKTEAPAKKATTAKKTTAKKETK